MEASEQARQRWIVVALSVAVAATRFLAVSHSMWDWDEALFALSLHDYDVAAHHPHPPGFPLFVGVARLFRLLIHDDFRALRAVSLIASMFLFPAMVALGRALRFSFGVTIGAALLFVFMPNVWYYGGTAFSDIFCLALLLFGLALLLRAASRAESRSDFFGGTLLFSLSLLVRPQNVLCAYAWFAAAWTRVRQKRWSAIVAAALLSIVIVATGYGIAAKVTGVAQYVKAVRAHQKYIAAVDGYQNPRRPPWFSLIPSFVIDPYDGGKGPEIVFGLAVLALLIPKRRDIEAMAIFFPGLVLALFLLNPTGSARLSLEYAPLLALLAADGAARLGSAAAKVARMPRLASAVLALIVLVLVGRAIVWSLPAFRVVRHTDSPPVQAMKWVRQNLPAGSTMFVDGAYGPHADYYLKGYDTHFVDGPDELAKVPPVRNAWYVADRPSPNTNATNFQRPRVKLWSLFTQRYFESSVRPMVGSVRYLDGWYDEETAGTESWRWMAKDAHLLLQPIPAGGEFRFNASVPIDIETPPVVAVTIDGRLMERFVATTHDFSRRYAVPPSPSPHVVAFDLDHVVNPARAHKGGDARDLGMLIRDIAWQP